MSTKAQNKLTDREVQMVLLGEANFDDGQELFWTGIGDLSFDVDGDNSDETFKGVGNLLQVSSITENAEIRAQGVQLSLVGIDGDTFDNLDDALNVHVQGRQATIWLMFLDEDAQPILDPLIMMRGRMDSLSIQENVDTVATSVTVENTLVDLLKPRIHRLTDRDQKEEFSSDDGLEFINDLQDKQLAWGAETDSKAGQNRSSPPKTNQRPAVPSRGLPARSPATQMTPRGRRGLPPRSNNDSHSGPAGGP